VLLLADIKTYCMECPYDEAEPSFAGLESVLQVVIRVRERNKDTSEEGSPQLHSSLGQSQRRRSLFGALSASVGKGVESKRRVALEEDMLRIYKVSTNRNSVNVSAISDDAAPEEPLYAIHLSTVAFPKTEGGTIRKGSQSKDDMLCVTFVTSAVTLLLVFVHSFRPLICFGKVSNGGVYVSISYPRGRKRMEGTFGR
jgi:hypothetical protein